MWRVPSNFLAVLVDDGSHPPVLTHPQSIERERGTVFGDEVWRVLFDLLSGGSLVAHW